MFLCSYQASKDTKNCSDAVFIYNEDERGRFFSSPVITSSPFLCDSTIKLSWALKGDGESSFVG